MPQISLEALHRFHSYCARFPSEVVETVLEKYTKPGDSVLDLFCGSGTTLVASLAHQRKVVGADIDTLAGMLSEVKCAPQAPEQYAKWRKEFTAKLANDFEDLARAWKPSPPPRPGTIWSLGPLELRIPTFPELNYWFPPQLTAALAASRWGGICGSGSIRTGDLSYSPQDPRSHREPQGDLAWFTRSSF